VTERADAWQRYEAARQAAEGAPTLSDVADESRRALRAAQAADCNAGYHDDPDHTGVCIRCGTEL